MTIPGIAPPSNPQPFMAPAEVAFLERSLRRTDRFWEWGSGGSSFWLAARVRHLTTVEHQAPYAAALVQRAPSNVSVIYAPSDLPYQEGTDNDGHLEEFRSYIEIYNGRNIDAILIDGRARYWCARHVAETSPYGPFPGLRLFVHDAQRPECQRIWIPVEEGVESKWRLVERVENLVLLEPVF